MRKEKDELYRAYLLRCWREGDVATDNEPLWRFCVENVFGERRRQGFGSLEALLAFLRVELTRKEGGA
jgi:CRISPR/Cas system endoribonuclease Cas6 (RAMP superfamily)